MKFKIDENLPVDFAVALRLGGHDAMTVVEESLGGAADHAIMDQSIKENRSLITLDLDFANLSTYPPEETPGIIVFRVHRQDTPHLLAGLRQVIPLLKHEALKGHLWIVEENRVRIRGGRLI
jgi:predicted nuclease of predicted toxin-antitoxin system